MSSASGPGGGDDDHPKTINDLFEFYYRQFKPLYSRICSDNSPPFELLVEVVAAFDHISRYWKYREDEAECVDRAAGHLKRGAFDAYKLTLRDARDGYDRLCRTNTSLIDNGEFDRQYLEAWTKIKTGAIHARSCEGHTIDDWHRAFVIWDAVYRDCAKFDARFVDSPHINWAQRRGWIQFAKVRVESFVIGAIASAAAGLCIWWWAR